MSSLLSLALAAGPDPVQPPVQPSTPSLTVVAKHCDSCPYVAYFEGAPPEADEAEQAVNSIWDECNLTDLKRRLKPSVFIASHDGSKMEDCCETVFGLSGISTSHDSHVVDVPFLYCGTYKEVAANAGYRVDDGGSLALPRRSDQDGDSSSGRVESSVQSINVTAAHLLNMALSHTSNVYVPWCHADPCGQPVRNVCAGDFALVCHWAETSSNEGVGYEFQLFDRSAPDEPVYVWDFLVSSMEAQGVTEEMMEAVEAVILLGDDSESEEGNESVDSVISST